MAGLLILAVIGVYVFLSKFIIKKVYEKKQSVKMKYIALAVMVLIPTWDVVLGYPIYAYLCLTKAGVHIYKTVDNVEGFYVGEKDAEYEPYEPYKGYKYIEYQEVKHQKPTGKYYRSYWVNFWEDTNAAKNCVPSVHNYGDYAEAIKRGQCIVKEEIMEKEVSQWDTSFDNISMDSFIIPLLDIDLIQNAHIKNRITNETLSEDYSVYFNGIWILGYITSISTGHPRLFYCGSRNNIFTIYYSTLKPKGEN
jgi:hypothetical protein